MAFSQEPSRGPSGILKMVITLTTHEAGSEYPDGAAFVLDVLMSNGDVVTRAGDLVPHITTAQRQALMGFMADLRTQAETQIVGTP